ncbi:uncharacterized protein HMPREF1120_03389 [Exophiala dermatitidis NIH/UT8656]|uniref:Uncharacterized protein n=1 Tax=Exophiala dermatitidis (strain ATCC 34100 / CBS 525.76 / NIH/UT8656) TaxID=858893 RepID=H6BWJ8_EXODN|nr:uncharacterized protein HMPREF1120_03389 [Exophiala dermatitidis NIH/UT8656]EHY55244.1 hypothetical protein HMPREF1120_03389 [Exophiala dermatitidis NIH/UT8656]
MVGQREDHSAVHAARVASSTSVRQGVRSLSETLPRRYRHERAEKTCHGQDHQPTILHYFLHHPDRRRMTRPSASLKDPARRAPAPDFEDPYLQLCTLHRVSPTLRPPTMARNSCQIGLCRWQAILGCNRHGAQMPRYYRAAKLSRVAGRRA